MKGRAKLWGAVAALACLAAGGEAGALSPCPSPRMYLIVCCPKPCPTFDAKQAAGRAIGLLKERSKLQTYEENNQQVAQVSQTLGAPGPRSSTTHQCEVENTAASEPEAERARTAAQQVGTEDRVKGAEGVAFSAVSSGDELSERLAVAIDVAAERGERAAQGARNARDARDFWRRASELEMAAQELESLGRQAKLAGDRIRVAAQTGTGLEPSTRRAEKRDAKLRGGGAERRDL